jgi:uncharacterized membrane protein
MRGFAFFAVVTLTIALATPAHASMQVCNQTSQGVRVAIGHFDGKVWTSAGWWPIAPKQCAGLVTGPLDARFYYLYAIDGEGGVWEGDTHFCTAPNNFTIARRSVCATSGFDRRGFFQVDTGRSPDWIQSLSNSKSACRQVPGHYLTHFIVGPPAGPGCRTEWPPWATWRTP